MAGDVYVTFGADTGGLESAMAVSKAAVNAYAREITGLAREMQKTGAAADSELGSKLQEVGAKLAEAKERAAGFGEQLKGSGEGAKAMGEAVDRTRESLLHLAEIAGIVLSVEGLKEWVASSAELGEQMVRAGAMMGTTAEQASELAAMAALTGTNFGTLEKQVERLQLSLDKAGQATGPVAQGLAALGLKADELRGLSIPEQMDKIAQATARFADGGNKTAAIMAVLGRNGAEMIPILDRGAEGLEELRQAAQASGAVMSNETAEAFAQTREHITEMQLAWQGLSNRLFEVARGPIDAVIQKIALLLEKMDAKSITAWGVAVVDASAAATTAIGDMAIEGVAHMQVLLDHLKDIWNLLKAINSLSFNFGEGELKNVSDQLVHPGSPSSPYGAIKPLRTDTDSAIADFNLQVALAAQKVKALLDSGGKPAGASGNTDVFSQLLAGLPKPQAGTMNIGGADTAGLKAARDQLAATLEAGQNEIKAAQDAYGQKTKLWAAEVQTKQLTEAQKLQLSIAGLDEEYAAEKNVLDRELALDNLKPQQRQKILNEIAALERKHADEMIALQIQAVEAINAKWQSVFSTMNGAITSQISPLLKGTETIGQAFKNMFATMIEAAIKAFAEMALRWAENQALHLAGIGQITAATVAGQAVQTGAIASGAAAQKAINATTISGDAGRAAAGAYAAVAGIPIIGPILAPVAAGVAFAGVEAFGAFETGAWELPQKVLALLHPGEMVVPAGPAQAFRDAMTGNGGGGGGSHVTVHHSTNFTVNAVDADGVAKFFRNNTKSILSSINHGIKTGAHLGLAKLAT